MLTRAQLLMGNSSQGVVLAGQTQGVRQGVGVIIAADGTISFDSVTATGVLKTNNPTAYNAYVWPTTLGAVGQQLQLGTAGALSWEDPDQIPWTAKGQLIVGTGLNTSTILSVGVDGSILIADSTQASGLGYTTNFVATTGATSAANLPAGATGLRPVTPSTGAFRYNSTTTSLEFYNGSGWETVASSSTNSFVEQTSTTGAAVMPAGTQLQRPGGPAGGFFRFNDDTDHMEFWNGTSWQEVASGNSPTPPVPATIVSSVTGTLPITVATGTSTPVIAINAATTALLGSVQLADAAASQGGTSATLASTPAFSVPKDASGMTGSAYLPAGTTAQRPVATAYTGQFRYNTTVPQLEYSDGATWIALGGLGAATLVQAQAGTLTSVAATPQTAVPKDASGMTGAALIPAGTTAQRPAVAVTGMQRFNTTSGYEEVYTGATSLWQKLAYLTSPSPTPTDLTLSSISYDDGVYVCNNLTVPAGVTATTTGIQLVFIVYGNAVIDGNISISAAVPGGPGGQSNNGSTVSPTAGFNFGLNGGTYSAFLSSAGSGGFAGGAYSNTSGADASRAGLGGKGGGGIIIKCFGTVTISATSTLSCNGGNAGNGILALGNANAGGGGGGSGGLIAIYGGLSLSAGGTLNANGGNGGAGTSNYFPNDAYGGAGGAGGIIILESPALTDTSTKNVAGGTFGANAIVAGGGGSVTGGIGAGYGGLGGNINVISAPTAGSTGIFLTSGFPI